MVTCKPTAERHNVKEGYLLIESQSIWKPFSLKAKYFILTNECMYCFKRRGELTSIPHDVVYLDDIGVSVSEQRRGIRRRYCIKLTSHDTRKTLRLFCFTAEERDSWYTSIMQALASRFTENLGEKQAVTLKNMDRKSKILLQQRSKSISCVELTELGVVEEDHITPIQDLVDFSDYTIKNKKKYSSSSLDIPLFYSLNSNLKNKRSSLIPFLSDKRKSKLRTDSLTNMDDLSDESEMSPFSTLTDKKKLKRKKISLGRR